MLKRKKSSLIIVTLFILFFLSVMALRLGYSLRLKAELTDRYLERLKSLYIAKAGLSLVMESLKQDKLNSSFDHPSEQWRLKFKIGDLPEPLTLSDASGKVIGTYRVSLIDEASKLNINQATYNDLASLARRLKAQDTARSAKNIISYRNSNKPLDKFLTLYDLLKLKEVRPEVFFGSDANDNEMVDPWEGGPRLGIKDFVTVHSAKINVNSASFDVLMTIPEMTPSVAQALIEKRKRTPFKSLEEIKDISGISQDIYNQIVSKAGVSSDHFKVGITAVSRKSGSLRQIVAVIDRSGEEPKITYYRQD